MIIFIDAKKTEQIWQWVLKQAGKLKDQTQTHYNTSQDTELLFQRASGVYFTLDEEENITIVDVTQKVTANFHQNVEKVTKQFYEKFKKEHTDFLHFINGIDDIKNKEWYGSLMLNRLMFCYFIQKKRFLDNNTHYLRDKLKQCKERKGEGEFYSFYRSFLLTLFHKGLGNPDTIAHKELIGKIPYLNGGLFDEHELEINNSIEIEDSAFVKIFDFFDQYEWHLDTREKASGKEINPDVIGFIFEKYINDRANMGAYYTKEDITDYISKNCIIPFLFDETKRHAPKHFDADAELWQMLKNSGDTYIYDSVKKGCDLTLPEHIDVGIKNVKARTEWNKPGDSAFALPTEIWREVVERRNRYFDIKNKIESGEITNINDFINYNLNIREFTKDAIENSNEPEFIRKFYHALQNVTILDPTCGSGAFLFAALNILETIYHNCILRMRNFIDDEDRNNAAEKNNFKHKYTDFRKILENIQNPQHPNQQYFVYKTIILRNLYGVDIMKEAVEIAKLRLFLKLVATVDADHRKDNLGLEPLPDIDFNIRAGNTLVGFATQTELQTAFTQQFDFGSNEKDINEKCEMVAKAFKYHKDIQLTDGEKYSTFKTAKDDLNTRLKNLNTELNKLLHKQAEQLLFDDWLKTHQPFHWFAEFYEIIHDKKGFDVVIGNPPYVEYTEVKETYKLSGFITGSCGNLYAMVIEKSLKILNERGKIGFIVPLSSVSTPRMDKLVQVYKSLNLIKFFSFYAGDSNPGVLFNGVKSQLSIHLIFKSNLNLTFTTNYIRWQDDFRLELFNSINYSPQPNLDSKSDILMKLGSKLQLNVLNKINLKRISVSSYFLQRSNEKLYYRNASGSYYRLFFIAPPQLYINGNLQPSSTLKEINLTVQKEILHSLFSSSLFNWYWTVISDNYHITKKEFQNFHFAINENSSEKLINLSKRLDESHNANSKFRDENDKKLNKRKVQIFEPRKSKELIDEIDTVLAEHYGFTDEELDFIINYDIKYRNG